MAAHISCHTRDYQPSSLPAPRPSMRDHGILSGYEQHLGLHDTGPYPKPGSRSYGGVGADSEADPLLMHPAPTRLPSDRQDHFQMLDPLLCVTPEKSRGPQQAKRAMHSTENLKLGSSEGILSDRPENSQKVRFDTTVEVKHMSPETSTETSTFDSTPSPLQPSIEVEVSQRHFLDQVAWGSSPGSGWGGIESMHSMPLLNSDHEETSSTMFQQTPDHLAPSPTQDSDDVIPSTQRLLHSSSPISVVAKDFLDTDYQSFDGTSLKKNSRKEKRCDNITRTARTVAKTKSELPNELGIVGREDLEGVLARPEFNSTLRVRKEIKDLEEADLDIAAAVQKKLKVSNKLRNQIDEKASARLNATRPQFSGLVSVEVVGEDVLQRAALERAAKMRLPGSSKPVKTESESVAAPDILDLFTPDLQRETASYTLEGIPSPRLEPQTASRQRAFDVYRHIRTWQGC